MKRLALAAVLALTAPFAQAASPTPQQIDALMTTMDMATMVDGMFQQMETPMRQMATSALPANASDADRARLDAFIAHEQTILREEMRWEKMAPIYRRIYADVFTAEEVEAMTRFYSSPDGRSILRKMPQAMGRSMQEMQPIMQSMMRRMLADLQKEFGAAK